MNLNALLHHFAQPWALVCLALLPVLSVSGWLARRRRRRALARLGNLPALHSLATVSAWRRSMRGTCLSLGLIAAIVATAGPRWGISQQPLTAAGRDVVVVLDVSRSMQAEDVLPNRLGRARQALGELVDAVQRSGGQRLGLVVFAGQARIVCPLTPDCDHFREVLADLDPTDPLLAAKTNEDRPVSGTRIGLGLRQALSLHDARFSGQQDILLLSDGDDPVHDGDWQSGADAARERGIPVYTVGIGNPDETCIIPDDTGRPLLHNDREVRTRLEEAPLLEIARLTNGVYLPARLDLPPLPEWFQKYIRNRAGHVNDEDLLPTPQPHHEPFFLAAAGLFALSILIGDRPRTRQKKQVALAQPAARAAVLVAGLFVAVLLQGAAPPHTPEDLVRAGNTAFHEENYELALDLFTQAEERSTDPGLVAFNKGAALYRLGQHAQAEKHYLCSLEDATGARRAQVNYNLANTVLRQAQKHMDSFAAFDRAIQYYEDCLREESASPALLEDARFNLQLARALRQQVKPRDDPRDPEKNQPDPKNDPDNREKEEPRLGPGSTAPEPTEDPSGKQTGSRKEMGKEARVSSRPIGGIGTLPPIPDEDDLVQMPREDALEHLRRATERLLGERKELRRPASPNTSNLLNW